MNSIIELEPKPVWEYFQEILGIPRPSKHEERIIEYLKQFAAKNKLKYKSDDVGNLVISKPATPGFESKPTIILQSHVDMVCEKNSDSDHDFSKDPIIPQMDSDWVKATGTTLGADDGIGIALMLAVLTNKDVKHGSLECLFTVDEETGLTGAFGLQPDLIHGDILINLDSEDEGEIFIGCAGGKDTVATLPIKTIRCDSSKKAFIISITGLKGGHSGDDIHRGYGNSIKILGELLLSASENYAFDIYRFDGGNLHNAIPREVFASVIVDNNQSDQFIESIKKEFEAVKLSYIEADPGMTLNIDSIANPGICIEKENKNSLLWAIHNCPSGVIAWSKEIEGLVETSTNLASVKFTPNNRIEIVTSQRSSSDVEKESIVYHVAKGFISEGFDVTHSDGYPGWAPNRDSSILKVAEGSYEKLFGKKPLVKAIHAGLECGLFLQKKQGLDMISIGPTIKGVHSPDERLEIKTVKMTWDFLVEILKSVD